MYHFIVTLQWPTGRGFAQGSYRGTTPGHGTRRETVNRLLAQICRENGIPEDASILFFSLEPDGDLR